jgi:hypothetical protein
MTATGSFDRRKSLQELEHNDWGDPNYDSYLVTTVHRLRRKPLTEFTLEDLRIVIGQGIGLPFLVPLAVERLEEEPLAEGDFYPGDLLQAVLRAGEAFWANHPDSVQRVRKVVSRVKNLLPSLDEIDRSTVLEVLATAPRSLTE